MHSQVPVCVVKMQEFRLQLLHISVDKSSKNHATLLTIKYGAWMLWESDTPIQWLT